MRARSAVWRVIDIAGFGLAAGNFGFHAVLYGGAALGIWRGDPPAYPIAALGCLWAALGSFGLARDAIKPLDTPETKPLSKRQDGVS